MSSFFCLVVREIIILECKYLVLTDLTIENTLSLWSDETLSLPLSFCTNEKAENFLG